jgi:hypothetical protein
MYDHDKIFGSELQFFRFRALVGTSQGSSFPSKWKYGDSSGPVDSLDLSCRAIAEAKSENFPQLSAPWLRTS